MGNLEIVVVQSGWVLVGEVTAQNAETRIDNASVVRQWGTTKGLGELALKGPLPATTLDYCAAAVVKNHAVIMRIPCVMSAWQEYLSEKRV